MCKMTELNEQAIFVFYQLNGEQSWDYEEFVEQWNWIGAGSTKNPKYPREEQFNGPKKSKKQMRDLLKNFFDELKNNEKIIRYKIRYGYKP